MANLVTVGRMTGGECTQIVAAGMTVRAAFKLIGHEEYADGAITIDGVAATADTVIGADAQSVLSEKQLKGNA